MAKHNSQIEFQKQLTLTKFSFLYLFSEKMAQLNKLDFFKILENAQKEGSETSFPDVNFQFFDKVKHFYFNVNSFLFWNRDVI